jgi:hypothetical protein
MSWAIPPLLLWHGKGKVRRRRGHESPEGDQRYGSTLSLTSSLGDKWVVNATPRQLYPRERDPVPIVQKARWAPGSVWTAAENLALTGTRSPNQAARSETLYRLSYSGPSYGMDKYKFTYFLLSCSHIQGVQYMTQGTARTGAGLVISPVSSVGVFIATWF